MESRWTLETSESDLRGQISMACGALYIIGKILKRRCLKWARIAHLEIWNTSYDQMKGRESNCQFDSQPEKVGNRPEIPLESSRRELQLCFRTHFDSRSARKVMGLQSPGSPAGRDFGNPGKKSHLDVVSAERRREYYKGEGDGFPQVRAMVSLVCPCCRWLVLAPKVLQLCTNHFVWIVCRLVWVNKLVNSS